MNLDMSIHRLASREAEMLGLAHVLVAKKRQELDLRLLRQKVLQGSAATGAGVDSTLQQMRDESEQAREPLPEHDTGVLLDKTA